MNGNNRNAFNLVLVRYFCIKFLKRGYTKLETSKRGWKRKSEWSFFLQQVTYSFKNFQTIKTFGRDIYEGNIALKEADEYQASLLVEIINFRKIIKPRCQEKKTRKVNCS